ncbi:hypothetical protein [Hydrotalea sp.]|uniref:hypothetical protein n=1 Tax=Hydrotalea sp. TaxID=2881279 RepID=UPI0025867D50|nr:hypothetical protein [Hydrotalea sp.]
MYKLVIILYVVILVLYMLFTRQPDYFDGEMTVGTIHMQTDSITHRQTLFASFDLGKSNYHVNAAYSLRNLREGEKVAVIYDTTRPQRAAIYAWWGYWLQWDEIAGSIIIAVVLWGVAVLLTNNPTEESRLEQLKEPDDKPQRKYS